jgi:hypothetical protein
MDDACVIVVSGLVIILLAVITGFKTRPIASGNLLIGKHATKPKNYKFRLKIG